MTEEERYFWSQVTKTETCWLWKGRTEYGCGAFLLGNPELMISAKHAAWVFVNGPVPTGMRVLQRCMNRRCVNPEHLFLGPVHKQRRYVRGRRALTELRNYWREAS